MKLEDEIKRIVTEMKASSGAIMVRSVDDNELLMCAVSYNMPKAWVAFRATPHKGASASPLNPTPYFSLQAQKYAKAPQRAKTAGNP
jgi:hypothetical protein